MLVPFYSASIGVHRRRRPLDNCDMPNMDDIRSKSENKLVTVCIKCGQKLRTPIAYKTLEVKCPKCNNEFLYNYIAEFGNDGAHYTKLQIKTIAVIVGYILLVMASCIIFMAIQFSNNFQGWSPLPLLFWVIIYGWIGIFVIPKLIDYKTFTKYLPMKLLLINRQGIIYLDGELNAKECLNWSEIKSAKYIYVRHMFAGLVETKREPACIELDVSGKGKILVPPVIFFTKEERLKIISEILMQYHFMTPY